MLRYFLLLFLTLPLLSCAAPSASPGPEATTTPAVQLATFTPSPRQPPAPATPKPLIASNQHVGPAWQMLFPGAEIAQTSDGLTLLRHVPNRVDYAISYDPDPGQVRFLSQWLDESPAARAAVNCGFYWEREGRYLHLGLLEIDRERLATVRPHWGAALILRGDRAKIIRQPKKTIPAMTLGIQGWPTLLWRGQIVAGLDEIDQGDVARRTAVGMDAAGRVVWAVAPQGDTLRAFARRLQQADISLIDAVNLDGGASTGLRWREAPPPAAQRGVDSMPIPCAITFSPLVK